MKMFILVGIFLSVCISFWMLSSESTHNYIWNEKTKTIVLVSLIVFSMLFAYVIDAFTQGSFKIF